MRSECGTDLFTDVFVLGSQRRLTLWQSMGLVDNHELGSMLN